MILKKAVEKQIRNNLPLYFFVLVFFVAGIAAGAFTVDALSSMQKEELVSYFQSFFSILDKEPVQSATVFKQSFLNNSQFVLIIWVLGITVIGIPLILMVIGIKGFIIGFSVSFLVEGMGLRGLLFALAAVLPQNLLIVPGILVAGVLGLSFSISMLRRKKSKTKKSFSSELTVYSFNILLALLILFVGSLIEGYITPVFIKLFSH
ncbi:MAG: stage II sporulation protein M [Bacillota bacterium]|jgi:stage II sporulation protein M|nr:stage II sporulation protein M [Bacillota bacterium]MDD3298273.1 stage II sporulation protein M [Bacillota bacterium]MDD3851940.1 stage II sporulation protein M [Bacillota bacterium]MDD4707808.1 stage II sporulation protein M [Bacillota bacterium]